MRRLAALPLLLGLLALAPAAAASIVTTHEGAWGASDERSCLAENATRAPALRAEREAMIPSAPTARIDGAIGVHGGLGAPSGVGGYVGHTAEGTPAGIGWTAFARADVLATRPVWLSVQAFALTTPRIDAASVMTDVFVGWDFHGWGNSWSAMRRKRSTELAYDCVFGRYDVALVGGFKEVFVFGDPRLDGWHALLGGVQMRFLRHFMGGPFGIDFDILGVYDPTTHGAGAQVMDVLHIGVFDFTQSIGFAWHRGVWGTLAIGAGFDLL
jgi:hypothetical protein